MKQVVKPTLVHALVALGKQVCRTSPIEANRCIRLQSTDNALRLTTVGRHETLTAELPAAGDEAIDAITNFAELKGAVRGVSTGMVSFHQEEKVLTVEIDSGRKVETFTFPMVTVDWPDAVAVPGSVIPATLPEGFVQLLNTVAPLVDCQNTRAVLQGINLSRDGIVVTNGRELLNIPCEIAADSTTIPFPLALLATKERGCGTLMVWREHEEAFFQIQLGNWTWTGKALSGDYPNWKHVVPDVNYLPHVVDLDVDRAAQLEIFLKNVPDSPPNNPVTLAQGDDGTLNVVSDTGSKTSVVAEFPQPWGDFTISVNKEMLLRLLGEGYHRIACGDTHLPFIATGGVGTYIAMPLNVTKNNVHPKPKEESKMNENTPVVAAPVQPVAREDGTSNPLDDLAAAVESFKTRLRAMSEESALLSRKVKEAAFVQKQKEREFVHAQRVLERVRMAI